MGAKNIATTIYSNIFDFYRNPPFWAAVPKGRCPAGHRGEFPDVCPSVRPSIRPSAPPPAPLRLKNVETKSADRKKDLISPFSNRCCYSSISNLYHFKTKKATDTRHDSNERSFEGLYRPAQFQSIFLTLCLLMVQKKGFKIRHFLCPPTLTHKKLNSER